MTFQTLAQVETEKRIILPDTSLCAIVRDEMINPAQLPGKSGIRSFVESHVPYVEQAVIVDTGSIDGTRQELEQLAHEFPNLRVYDRPFDDYASARNDSLKRVKTKRALVLDVDELIIRRDLKDLTKTLLEYGSQFIGIRIINVGDRGDTYEGGGHNPRLFDKSGVKFINKDGKMWEFLHKKNINPFSSKTEAICTDFYVGVIFHFLPIPLDGTRPLILKNSHWYSVRDFSEPPSIRTGFKYWKQPNPHREKYR